LNYKHHEWIALPWHIRQTYLEGIENEGTSRNEYDESSSDSYQDLASADMDSLAAMGFDVS